LFSNPIKEYGNIWVGHHMYAWISMVKSSTFLPKGLSNLKISLRFTLKSKIFHLDKEGGVLVCYVNPCHCHFVHLHHSILVTYSPQMWVVHQTHPLFIESFVTCSPICKNVSPKVKTQKFSNFHYLKPDNVDFVCDLFVA
jgi:hypothetical protein